MKHSTLPLETSKAIFLPGSSYLHAHDRWTGLGQHGWKAAKCWMCWESCLDWSYLPRLWPRVTPVTLLNKNSYWTALYERRSERWVKSDTVCGLCRRKCEKVRYLEMCTGTQYCLVSVGDLLCLHCATWIKGSVSLPIKHTPTNTNFGLWVISVCHCFKGWPWPSPTTPLPCPELHWQYYNACLDICLVYMKGIFWLSVFVKADLLHNCFMIVIRYKLRWFLNRTLCNRDYAIPLEQRSKWKKTNKCTVAIF